MTTNPFTPGRSPVRRRHLRVALPPLAQLHADTPCPFALIDRNQTVLRAASLPLARIAQEAPAAPVYVALAPQDAVVLNLTVPPVGARQLPAAVRFALEPLVLSDLDTLCIAHGARDPDGQVCVAWIDRATLTRAWDLLADTGLNVAAMMAHEFFIPADDAQPQQALQAPVDARWTAALPAWSFAQALHRPAQTMRPWRGTIALAAGVAALWIGGFAIYAMRQQQEWQSLKTAMEDTVRSSFPDIPIVIAPLQQARDALDGLRVANGLSETGDFLALAQVAARTLGFAAGHVQSMYYVDGTLSLTLAEGYIPPANDAELAQAVRAHALELEKDGIVDHTWRIRPSSESSSQGQRP